MTWCFWPFGKRIEEDRIKLEDLAKLWLRKHEATWREALQKGDDVDVEYEDKKTRGWLQGQIKSFNGDSLEILVPQVGALSVLDRYSCYLAKPGKNSRQDREWRSQCLEDPALCHYLIDCHDDYRWEEATIIETKTEKREGCSVLLAYVAFRVYRNMGIRRLKTDDVGVFDGWSQRYDEWIPIYSPRI